MRWRVFLASGKIIVGERRLLEKFDMVGFWMSNIDEKGSTVDCKGAVFVPWNAVSYIEEVV